MPESINNLPDHDKLTTLVEKVDNLASSQDKFHAEMRDSLDDLKNNYQGRLNDHETRIGKLEGARIKTNTLVSIGIGILSLLATLLIYHIVK
jgi:uncharacterized protein YpuA (DUF1002 family)